MDGSVYKDHASHVDEYRHSRYYHNYVSHICDDTDMQASTERENLLRVMVRVGKVELEG